MKIFAGLKRMCDLPVPYVESVTIKCFMCGEKLWLCKHCYNRNNDHDVIGFCDTHGLSPEGAFKYWIKEQANKVVSKAALEQKCGLSRKKKSEPEGADLSPTRTVLTTTKKVERLD